jgi:hypothetical protein
MNYRHTQIGTVMIAAQLVVVGLFVYTVSIGQAEPPLVSWIVALLVIVVLSLFVSITVEIKADRLDVWFGPGLIRRRISLHDIASARAVRNPWYAGWGIRWMPGSYWLWSVSGFDAVELEFKNGKRFRIGTDEPDVLVQAIHHGK